MVDENKPTLGYWAIRGLAQQIRYQLAYCGVDFNDVKYEAGPAPDFSREAWMSVKFTLGLEFPNLPYFMDGKVKLTETAAIMKYIAKKWAPDLLGRNAAEVGLVEQIFPHIMELKNGVTGPCYRGMTHEEIIEANTPALQKLMTYLGNEKEWMCGSNLTYVDFIMAELLDLVHFVWGDKLWEDYPNAQSYRWRFFSLERIQAYCNSEDFMAKPFNNTVAKIGSADDMA